MTSNAPRKVIYDTDPGVDDAMAMYYALAHPGIELVGITTTFGNVHVAQATTNALYLTGLVQRAVPVATGADRPLHKKPEAPPAHIHGADGLGNLPLRHATTNQPDARSAAQFIVDMARANPGEITLVAVGPLGNLAAALALEPELPLMIREVILMGGTVLEPGNVSPVAEANIWNDPHSADAVFCAGWKLTMVGLDVTHQLILPVTLFERIAAHQRHVATDTLLHAVRFYADFYSDLYPHVAKIHGCFGHDVLAFVYLTNPALFTLERGRVRVAVDGLAQGQTMMRRKHIDYPQPGWDATVPTAQVCMRVQAGHCLQLIEDTLMGEWLPVIPKQACVPSVAPAAAAAPAADVPFRLPVVDYRSPTAAADFCRSLHETGFGVLANHPLPRDLVLRIYDEWQAFFNGNAKHHYAFDMQSQDGYFSAAVSETAKGYTQKDVKEFFHIYPWGRYPAEVTDAARQYYAHGTELAKTLLGWVETWSPEAVKARYAMPLPDMLTGSDHTLLRVLHYPPLTGQEPPGAVRAAAHGDINLLTILPAATEPGLQVLGKDQAWHDVPCDFGLLIVNIGDMLAEASGGYYPSTVHRVLNPVGEAARKPRISLPLFLHPRRDVVLSERYTVGSYFDERMRELRGAG